MCDVGVPPRRGSGGGRRVTTVEVRSAAGGGNGQYAHTSRLLREINPRERAVCRTGQTKLTVHEHTA